METNYTRVKIDPDFEKNYPEASPTATEAAMNLVRTADLLVKRISDLVQPFGLSPSSALALSIIVNEGVPLPPNEIAERLIISRATITGLLDSLERRGYVRRMPHTSDRRMLLIEPTESGCKVAHEFRLVVHKHQKEWLAVLSEAEQRQLVNTLHRLQSALVDEKD
jgi:MarR family 2-MHQ and catechol resistance regulon transcriptional repressor